jgi:hypothetical protein
MAKIGVECEGRLRGVKTLFVSAVELITNKHIIQDLLKENCTNHLYVSDHGNTLNYEAVGNMFENKQVTIEVTKVCGKQNMRRPSNVSLMLTLPQEYFNSVANLWEDDQVKFHSPEREVLCVAARNFIATTPDEFEGDTEL